MTRGFQRFPDFGSELKRKHPVHETCYDCAAFFDGCDAWPEGKKFSCWYCPRLPDVMPGTYGQKFPEKVFVPMDPTEARRPAKQPQEAPPRSSTRRPRIRSYLGLKPRTTRLPVPAAF